MSNDQAGVRRILATYEAQALVTGAEAWALEGEISREWLRSGGGRPDEVEARRRAVMERGRSQKG